MKPNRGRNALTIAGAVALTLAAAAAGAQSEPSTNLGEVVVTAQKRLEALADVPMSVSVVSGDALERAQADNFQDLLSLVPGFSLNSNTRGITRITLRGINTGGVASTVGVYVNDVPFGSSSGLANGAILSGDFDTFDMNRIEVLRGPQGTLYGASSLGGVVKYVANEPSLAGFEGRAQAAIEDVKGGEAGYSVKGVLNVPLGETVALRASGFYREEGGYVDSIGNNPIPSLQNPGVNIVDGSRFERDLNGVETSGGRIAALFNPSDTFSLNLTALFQDIRTDNRNTFEADPETYRPLYGDLVISRYHPEPQDIEYRVYSATIDWDTGPVTIQSVTSWGEFDHTFQSDVSLVPIQIAPGVFAPLTQVLTLLLSDPVTAQPGISAIQTQTTATEKFTQEFRLVSPESDSFEWLAGIYYTDEDSGIDPQAITGVIAGTEEPVPGLPNLGGGFLRSTYEELALFANATWHMTDRFDLSFGARWSDNDQEASQVLDGLLVGGLTEFDDVKSSESPFTWSVSPRFEISDTTSIYARVATGFRPGGPNVLPPTAPPDIPPSYDSDELTNYELGLKTASSDGRFALDVAAYFLDWDDVQLFASVENVGFNANGGTAESMGLEFTASLQATDALTLSLSGSVTEAELTEDTDPDLDPIDPDPDCIVCGLDGDPLPWVPDWSAALSADYEWTVFGDASAYLGGQLAYTGKQSAGFGVRDAGGNIREADAYTTFDLRAGLLVDHLSIELYGKNLGDEDGFTDIIGVGQFPNGAVGIATIRPRTIGLSFGVRF